MAGDSPKMARAAWQELLEPLRAEPRRAAILTDFDGTLAPIVAHADDAAMPSEAREILERLIDRYALVGAVWGGGPPTSGRGSGSTRSRTRATTGWSC